MNIRLLFFLVVTFLTLNTSFCQTTVVSGTISINEGAKVTNSADKKVNLNIKWVNATQMMVSNDGSFVGAQWEPLVPTKLAWRLAGEDGMKVVYAKFRDAKGNVSETVEAEIELDRTPPQNPSITINGGKDFTNNPHRVVMLELSCEDAAKMRISNRNDFLQATWIPFKEQITGWQLSAKDGVKQVYAQFMDNAGNVSSIVSDDITLDIMPPTNCKIDIENGANFINKRIVKLTLSAEGATEMIFKGGQWEPFKAVIENYDLGEGDGEKSVYVKFRDAVGNQSVVVTDKVILDTEAPKNCSIILNDGNKFTKSYSDVHVKLTAVGATEMMIGTDSTFARNKWIPFTALVPNFPVQDTDGKKTIYVKFRDAAGNESAVYSDDITLDKNPPKTSTISILSKNMGYDSLLRVKVIRDKEKMVDLQLFSEDADYMMISNLSTFFGANWEVYKPKYEKWHLGGNNEGERHVFAKFRDKAGNITQPVSDKVIVDTEPPLDARITINNNEEYATDKTKKVQLQLFARGASHMKISNEPNFEKATWEIYNPTKQWVLEGEDGIKSVYVKYKDFAGNESNSAVDNILLDRKPPYDCSIIINKGQDVTNNPDRQVVLKVKAKDAVLMQIDNSADFKNGRWQAYNENNINHQLVGEDGLKKVYVRFKDDAGNISEPFSDEIKLDRKPPMEGTVEINGGDKITNTANANVTLNISAKDATEMMISNQMDFKGAKWEPYKEQVEWTLTPGDGFKTVYVLFKDAIGNTSKTAFASIGVDREAPKAGRLTINEGKVYCTDINKYVTLKLYAVEATEMMISNKPDFSDAQWRKYQLILENWILDGEDGDKKVYAKFRDKAGNETQPIVAGIILDRQEPVGEEIIINNGEKYTNNPQNKVQLEIKALGDTYEMIISNSDKFIAPAAWEPYKEKMSYTLVGRDGLKQLFVKFRDKAGNESAVAKASINLDTEAPILSVFTINNGKTSTDKQDVTLSIKAKGAKYMMISNSAKFDDNALWEEYAETKAWVVPAGEGLKRVYIKLKDEAQNECGVRFADITLFKNF
jgi:hypothetical protein